MHVIILATAPKTKTVKVTKREQNLSATTFLRENIKALQRAILPQVGKLVNGDITAQEAQPAESNQINIPLHQNTECPNLNPAKPIK